MEIKEITKVIAARWLSMILIIAVAVGLAAAWTVTRPTVYTAKANGVVTSPIDNSNGSVSTSYTTNSLITAKLPSYVALGSLRSVADYAIAELSLDTTSEELVNRVKVTNLAETNFIQVSAQADTPEAARNLAEVWVRGMVREVNILETGNAGDQGSIYLSPKDVANLPTAPSSPNLQLNLAVGFILGVLLALVYVIIRHFMDQKIRSVETVEKNNGTVVIGNIPLDSSLSNERRLIINEYNDATTDADFMLSEALRSLRTNIQFINVDEPLKSITITSPLPGDGKSTLAANLAQSMAINGTRTVLIDADLRRPMQSNIFNIPDGAGLSDVIAGRADIEEVATTIGSTGNLVVLGAGSTPPNPSEILGSARMKNLIHSLEEEAFVIIDAPPTLPVTDAAIISRQTDGAIIVVTVGKTTHDILQKSLDTMAKVKSKTLGIVLNKVPLKGMGASYYGYQYKKSYYRNSSRK